MMTLFNYTLDPNILSYGLLGGLTLFIGGSIIKNIWFTDSNVDTIIETPTTDTGVDTIRALSADINNPSPTLHYFTPEQLSTIQSSTDLNEWITNNNLVDVGVQTEDQINLIDLLDSPINADTLISKLEKGTQTIQQVDMSIISNPDILANYNQKYIDSLNSVALQKFNEIKGLYSQELWDNVILDHRLAELISNYSVEQLSSSNFNELFYIIITLFNG